MNKMTITEALAEIKTLEKRIAKKQEFVMQYLVRQDQFKDPLEKDGGSTIAIMRERQAIRDMEERIIAIRRAIQKANDATDVTVSGITRTISEWLIWMREIVNKNKKHTFLHGMRNNVMKVRKEVLQKGLNVVTSKEAVQNLTDVIINISEQELADEIELAEQIVGSLDGQLSLKNATVMVEV